MSFPLCFGPKKTSLKCGQLFQKHYLYVMRDGRKRNVSIAEMYKHAKIERVALEQQVAKDKRGSRIQETTH